MYREHEIALPNELTFDQLIRRKERLVRELIGNLVNTQFIRQMERWVRFLVRICIRCIEQAAGRLRAYAGADVCAAQRKKSQELSECSKDNGGMTPQKLHDNISLSRARLLLTFRTQYWPRTDIIRVSIAAACLSGVSSDLSAIGSLPESADEKTAYAAPDIGRTGSGIRGLQSWALRLRHSILRFCRRIA